MTFFDPLRPAHLDTKMALHMRFMGGQNGSGQKCFDAVLTEQTNMHIHPFGFVSYAIAHSKHNKQFAMLHNKAHVWLGLEFGWLELDNHSCNECSFRPFLLCWCFWRL